MFGVRHIGRSLGQVLEVVQGSFCRGHAFSSYRSYITSLHLEITTRKVNLIDENGLRLIKALHLNFSSEFVIFFTLSGSASIPSEDIW